MESAGVVADTQEKPSLQAAFFFFNILKLSYLEGIVDMR
jgi:hypothetical protein